MSYQEKLSCKRKKCSMDLTVPMKLIVKGNSLIDVTRCPRCHETYKRILPMSDKKGWIRLVARPFFQCDVCGTANEDNYHVVGGNYNLWHANRLKTITVCRNCRKKRAKVVSRTLWPEIVGEIKGPAEIPAPELNCPHCDAAISEGTKTCPTCKKDLLCSTCGAPTAPQASFCSSCGDKVIGIEAPAVGPPKERICPACHEQYDEGSIFCSVCGQELMCDKCSSVIREGALFCTNCGDAVTKGDLSE